MSLKDYINEPRKDWTKDNWLQHAWVQRYIEHPHKKEYLNQDIKYYNFSYKMT